MKTPKQQKPWVLEYRYTTGMNVAHFLDAINNPSIGLLRSKLKVDAQRIGIWRRSQALPWAVYLALMDKFKVPKFHVPPKMSRRNMPCRLPMELAPYVGMETLESTSDVPPVPPAETAVTPVTEVPAIPANNTILLRIEVVGQQPASQPQESHGNGNGTNINLRIITDELAGLKERILSLEVKYAGLRALPRLEPVPTLDPPKQPEHSEQKRPHAPVFTRTERHLLKAVSKQSPEVARDLSKQLHHQHG